MSNGGGSGGDRSLRMQRCEQWVGGDGLKSGTPAGGVIWARKPWWLLVDERGSMVDGGDSTRERDNRWFVVKRRKEAPIDGEETSTGEESTPSGAGGLKP